MNDRHDYSLHRGPDRRGFLHSAGLIGAGMALSESFLPAQQALSPLELSNTGPDRIPRKPFGRTQERVSVMGMGGYSLGDAPSLQEAIAIVHEAIDAADGRGDGQAHGVAQRLLDRCDALNNWLSVAP